MEQYQHNYNVRHSSARVYIERSFGILKAMFRRLKYLETSNLELANEIIIACCILHNIVREENSQNDINNFRFNEDSDIPALPHFTGNNAAKDKRNFIALTF